MIVRNTYFTEETDFKATKNTERIQNILDNPDNYSSNDLLKLGKDELYGVSSELREKLVQLGIEKFNITPYDLPSEEEEELPPLEDEEEEEIPTPEDIPR